MHSSFQVNNGPGPSSAGSTGNTSQPPSVSHVNYMGPAPVIQSQAGASAQTHNVQSQQNTPSQPSVLQELLLNPSTQNNQTLNSPRPPYTTQYQTRLALFEIVVQFFMIMEVARQKSYHVHRNFFDKIKLN